MALLLLDLDNTLIDRAAAFYAWSCEYVMNLGRPLGQDVEWLIEADRDGFEDRQILANKISDRFDLSPTARLTVPKALHDGLTDHLGPNSGTDHALAIAQAAGWTLHVVTNGSVTRQEQKIRIAGLHRRIAGWTISEAAGFRKPDPRIFEFAAHTHWEPLTNAWMIGDADTDIVGAFNAHIRSVWLRRGRAWTSYSGRPTHTADSLLEAIEIVVAAGA